jgi:hypothetical protein
LESSHSTKPIHSLEEIQKLAEMFPQNLKLFLAEKDGIVISGAFIFENQKIVQTQYLANNNLGREIGTLDLIIDHLIKNVYKDKNYFDFGMSNEDQGKFLNIGLIDQKEGFGARAIAHDFYELHIN